MPNGQEFNTDMQFEEHMRAMSNRELQEFVARQVYEIRTTISLHENRISILERKSNKIIGGAAAIGTGVGAAVIAIVSYFMGR